MYIYTYISFHLWHVYFLVSTNCQRRKNCSYKRFTETRVWLPGSAVNGTQSTFLHRTAALNHCKGLCMWHSGTLLRPPEQSVSVCGDAAIQHYVILDTRLGPHSNSWKNVCCFQCLFQYCVPPVYWTEWFCYLSITVCNSLKLFFILSRGYLISYNHKKSKQVPTKMPCRVLIKPN